LGGATAAVVPEGVAANHLLVRCARGTGVPCVPPSFLLDSLLARRPPLLHEAALTFGE